MSSKNIADNNSKRKSMKDVEHEDTAVMSKTNEPSLIKIIRIVGIFKSIIAICVTIIMATWFVSNLIHQEQLQNLSQQKDFEIHKLENNLEDLRQNTGNIIDELRFKLATAQSNISFSINDEMVGISRDDVFIDEIQARKLLLEDGRLYREDMIFPRLVNYDFHDEMRLKQLIDYITKDEFNLSDNPDEEVDPLWHGKSWVFFLKESKNDKKVKAKENSVVVMKTPNKAVWQAIRNIEDNSDSKSLSYVHGLPTHLQSLFLTVYLSQGTKYSFDQISYNKGLLFAEGDSIIIINNKNRVFSFAFLSVEYNNYIYTVIISMPHSNNIINPTWQEMRIFIKEFKIIIN